jgi:WD40 repeat protein
MRIARGLAPRPLGVLVVLLAATVGCTGKKGGDSGFGQGPAVLSGYNCAAATPDGKLLAAGIDETVKGWDLTTNKQIFSFDPGKVFAMAFSRDGSRLALASGKDIQICDAKTGQNPIFLNGHRVQVRALAFSPDGKLLVSGAGDANPFNRVFELKLWDAIEGKFLADLKGHAGVVNSVVFMPDGKTLLSGSSDATVVVWDVEGRKQKETLTDPNQINVVVLSPDAKTAASGGWNKVIKLWDTTSWKEKGNLEGHTDFVIALAISPDGTRLASAGTDHKVIVWDLVAQKQLVSLQGSNSAATTVRGMSFGPDGKDLVTVGLDGVVRVWDPASGTEKSTLN